jgi:hypothetical protein
VISKGREKFQQKRGEPSTIKNSLFRLDLGLAAISKQCDNYGICYFKDI